MLTYLALGLNLSKELFGELKILGLNLGISLPVIAISFWFMG
jgi:hypothetical protein